MTVTGETDCDIAIIGMACRFPGSRNIAEFWKNLASGVELISTLSDEELLAAGVDPGLLEDPLYVKADGALNEIDLFDAAFFGYTPREAELMDPQIRLFLEVAWEAMEDSGYSRDSLEARVGVYAGASLNSYLLSNLYSNPGVIESVGSFQTTLLNNRDYLPLHASYKLNLNGPSINVQTACSTSLVAAHLACQSLLGRECDIALAGGVSVRVPQRRGYLFEEGGILSPDGHCRAFDEAAAGTFASSGAGAVVLKRLAEAVADRDFIYSVIKGTAVNNDGANKAGFTAPTVEGQAAVIEEALAMAMVPPDTITYVEAHGTGTPLGDPIEIAALTEAFRRSTSAKRFCRIGSVKTNLGHLDAAAGVAGLIKTALCLQNGKIPPSLNFERANPRINFDESPFFVNTSLWDWDTGESPRRAGVSSFGIGGTNAHAVLEEAPVRERGGFPERCNLLVLSAKTATALEGAALNLTDYLAENSDVDLPDVAYTLQVGRKSMPFRSAVVCRGTTEAIDLLREARTEKKFEGYWAKGRRPVAFVFPGQGSQYAGMLKGLYDVEPVFRSEVDRCIGMVDPAVSGSLKSLLFSTISEDEDSGQRLQQTSLAQPALFVISYALARQLMNWGVKPDSMIGHSVGEYVAACLSGVMDLEDALSLVTLRGSLMNRIPPGAMLAIPLGYEETALAFGGTTGLSIASVNGPNLTVASGPFQSIELLEASLSERSVSYKRLRVSHAFHSEMMEPILGEFGSAVAKLRLSPPRIPYISNVTGAWITPGQATSSEYYARHLRQTVMFHRGVQELMVEPDRVLVEVGPGGLLKTSVRTQASDGEMRPIIQTVRGPRETSDDETVLMSAIAQLWTNGVDIDWDSVHQGKARNRLPLPTYPFERQRYWIEPGDLNTQEKAGIERKADDISKWFFRQSWKRNPLQRGANAAESDLGADESRPRLLLFADETGLAERTLALCNSGNVVCVIVRRGDEFQKSGDREYFINPLDTESYLRLLKDLRSIGDPPSLILHFWNESFFFGRLERSSAEPPIPFGFTSLVCLAQAIGELPDSRPIEILAITNQARDVVGTELENPVAALSLGPCRVIPLEYPYVKCRAIDVALSDHAGVASESVALDLVAEAMSGSSDGMVAYRNGRRWTAAIDRVAVDPNAPAHPVVRSDGAYLMTGGMGEIEFEIAKHLSDLGATKLIVVGLPPLDDGLSWQDCGTASIEEPLNPITERLNELRGRGLDVLADDAAAANYEDMGAVVEEARLRYGRINGVVHTAFATGGGMIQLRTPDSGATVTVPKVMGTNVIDELLKDEPLDFMVLFSTTLAVSGVFGQVDYCAANAYLDSFASARRARTGANVVSIAWDITSWEHWQEDAMTSAPELMSQIKEARQRYGITPGEAVRCIDVALALDSPHVIVSSRDFQKVLDSQHESKAALLAQIASLGRSATPSLPPGSSSDYVSPAGEIEESISAIWRDLLGLERIGASDDFFNLGGNSLVAIQAIHRLRKQFDIDLPMSALFEHSTVASLGAFIRDAYSETGDESEMEALLAEIENLTPDQVRAALAKEQSDSR